MPVTDWSPSASITTVAATVANVTPWSPWGSITTQGTLMRRRTATALTRVRLLYRTATGLVPASPFPTAPADLGTLAVTNFVASTPTTTGRVFTLQTNANISVTRIMEFRLATATTWTTHSTTTRIGSHTAGFSGQVADTDYETRMTFSAQGFNPLVITSATHPALAYRTAATVVAPTEPKLSFPPPVLIDPIVWNVSATDRTINVPSDRDLRIVMPSTAFSCRGGLEVVGGRNVVCIGGEYRVDTPYYLPEQNADGVRREAAGVNRFLKIRGRLNAVPRVIHLEGLKIHGTELFEGINWQAYQDTRVTFRQQNIWVGRLRAFLPNPVSGGTHDGGDWWQPIEDPYVDQIDRVQLTQQDYQALFLQPTQFGTAGRILGTWDYRNMQITAAATTRAQLLAMNGLEPPPERRLLSNVWVQPGVGQTATQAVKGTWINLNIGTAPAPFVDPTKVGVGYVSPGYL